MTGRGLVVGNWKMNLDYVEAVHLTQQLVTLLRAQPPAAVDVVVAPPFVDLRSVTSVVEAERAAMEVAAQHVSHRDRGAFTGEVSLDMLTRLGVSWVIVGHSERRTLFHMDDEVVRETTRAALARRVRPIVCVGENLAVRDGGDPAAFVTAQVGAALAGVDADPGAVVVAYEPIWAIGSGRSADAQQVRDMTMAIRDALTTHGLGGSRVLYGGSVTSENAGTLLDEGGVDGFLVGGASLKADSFHGIVRAVDDCYAGRR